MTRLVVFFIAALFIIGYAALAHSRPPAGTDPNSELSHWYKGLKDPASGIGCCSMSDCRTVEFRIKGDYYEVLITPDKYPVAQAQWFTVGNEHVLKDKPNPTGEAVACFVPGLGVVCLVLPEMS